MDAPLPAQHGASAGLWPQAKTRRSLRVWASGYAPTAGGEGRAKTVVTVLPDTAERYYSTPLFGV